MSIFVSSNRFAYVRTPGGYAPAAQRAGQRRPGAQVPYARCKMVKWNWM